LWWHRNRVWSWQFDHGTANITASGSFSVPAVGSGFASSSETSTVKNLTIVNGNIAARGSQHSAAIGSGHASRTRLSLAENLAILNGTITENGVYYGVGIGSG
jgi:DUF4097 and DUF4098 domain-containing protein YvlB